MTHLSSSEFVDFAEGTLDPRRASHMEHCAACRAEAESVRDVLRSTRVEADVPEPPAFFWDQFSARVRDRVENERPTRLGFLWGVRGLQPDMIVLAVAVVLVAGAFLARAPRSGNVTSQPVAAVFPAGDVDQEPDTTPDSNHAEVWAVLTAAAADLEIEDATAAGITVQPEAVDRAVFRLNDAERQELARLLQSEMRLSGD